MKGFGDFTDLEVYRLSEQLCDFIWGVVLHWDRLAQDTVGKQIIRAADSVGANIAEGHGSESGPENRRFVRIGRKSLNETRHWLVGVRNESCSRPNRRRPFLRYFKSSVRCSAAI